VLNPFRATIFQFADKYKTKIRFIRPLTLFSATFLCATAHSSPKLRAGCVRSRGCSKVINDDGIVVEIFD
jgi:hypothetical protein